jgi:hypothetical protein
VVGNNWDVTGATVYAIGAPATDLDVVAAFPQRTPYRLTFDDDFRRPGAPLGGRLQRLRVEAGNQVELALTARRPRAVSGHLAIEVTANGVRRTYLLADPAAPGQVYSERLVVTAAGASVPALVATSESPDPEPGLHVRLVQVAGPGAASVTVGSQSLPWRGAGAMVTMLVPGGDVWTAGRPSPPALEVTR